MLLRILTMVSLTITFLPESCAGQYVSPQEHAAHIRAIEAEAASYRAETARIAARMGYHYPQSEVSTLRQDVLLTSPGYDRPTYQPSARSYAYQAPVVTSWSLAAPAPRHTTPAYMPTYSPMVARSSYLPSRSYGIRSAGGRCGPGG
jgi:hypothetical protein